MLSWELFNEVEFTEGTDGGIDSWHDEMSKYLKQQDPNDHLVNTSAGGDNSTLALFDNNTALDQMQWHTYSGGIDKVLREESETFMAAYTKPVMCGEFGLTTSYPAGGAHPDDWADHVRKSMWTQMMSEAPAMFWYWDTYLNDKNLFSVFKPLADYLQGEDLVDKTGGEGKEIPFANNPMVSGTVYITPMQSDWSGTNIPNPFTSVIDSKGNPGNINGLHRYLHGSWQGVRNREISFTVDFQTGGAAVQLDVSAVSTSGTKSLQVFVDGVLQTTWTPAAAGLLTYTGINAGTHTIRIYNAGQDWVEFNNVRFTNVSYQSCTAYGYVGPTHAYGYVNNTSYGEYADPASVTNITGAVVRVGPLTNGSYSIQFWNPENGTTTSGGTIATTLDSLSIALPSFKKDIAYKVSPLTLPVRMLSLHGNFQEENVLLQWITTEESLGVIYYIQRLSGTAFETIGTLPGNGVAGNYTFVDEHPLQGENSYRIKWCENGEDFYSSRLYLRAMHDKFFAGPIPASERLEVQLTSPVPQKIELKIFSVKGEVLKSEFVSLCKGYNAVALPVDDLTPGVYVLMRSDTGEKLKVLVNR